MRLHTPFVCGDWFLCGVDMLVCIHVCVCVRVRVYFEHDGTCSVCLMTLILTSLLYSLTIHVHVHTNTLQHTHPGYFLLRFVQ